MLETHIVMSSLIFYLVLFYYASPHTYHALPHFSHGPNHHSYGFSSGKNSFVPRHLNSFVPRHFGYGPRPHRGDRFPRRPCFPTGGSHTHLELRHLDGPRFSQRGSRPTGPNGEVQRIVKTYSGRMVKC
jgi:hypothetical protein